MVTKKTSSKKPSAKEDARRGQSRFIDQPGQWKDVTPASVKRRNDKEWKKLEAMLEKKKK